MQDNITFISLVPKFLQFFELAKNEEDKEKRFEIWKEHYGFAAVPPGEAGMEIARNLLDNAWDKYLELVEQLAAWAADENAIKEKLDKVKELLNYDGQITMNVLYFVGGFEGNPFVAPLGDGNLALCLPVETEISDVFIAHELTHIVHQQKSGITSGYERSIATLIMQEGIATRSSQLIVPGFEGVDYIEDSLDPGWLSKCEEYENVILSGILPNLRKKDFDTLNKYTFGNGSSGVVNREAYYIGWVLVDYLLKSGETINSLASIREDELDDFVEKSISNYLLIKK